MILRRSIPNPEKRRCRSFSFFVSFLLLLQASAVWKRLDGSFSKIFLSVDAFHDCVQSRKRARNRGQRWRVLPQLFGHKETVTNDSALPSCQGGICVGMTNGPHQGGNASYPVAWNGTYGTRLESTMTVPDYPPGLVTEEDFSEITYYIWTDIFFGDEGLGRMNQLVPQLILGSALDGSSGPPTYNPKWNTVHTEWAFGAHYFFEVWNPTTNTTDAHAAYGKLFPAFPGEILRTTFELSHHPPKDFLSSDCGGDQASKTFHNPSILRSSASTSSRRVAEDSFAPTSPAWTLTMSVVGDPTRKSILTISEPYMGLGRHWSPKPSTSWLEPNFRNMCINACWELYGASNTEKLPGSGAEYRLTIEQAEPNKLLNATNNVQSPDYDTRDHYYDFTTWERDEGDGICPSCKVSEVHNHRKQEVFVEIDVSASGS